jgi:zinc protease
MTNSSFRATAPQPGPPRPYHFPAVERGTLPNGLRLLMARVDTAPVVSVRAVVRQGADHDPASRPGLASFVAEMIDEGTATRSAMDIAGEIANLGASLSSGCDWDGSYLSLDVLTRNLDAGLEIFADVLTRPAFAENEVERTRRERLTTILQNRDDPGTVAGETFAREVYRGTPYQHPLIGTPESLRGLAREELTSFHAANYSPELTSVIFAGNFDLSAVRQRIETRFGDLPSRGRPVRLSFSHPSVQETRVVIADRPQAVQSEIRLGHPSVDRSTPDYYPIIVMNAILGGVFTSRLNLNLREKNAFTYHVRSGFSMRRNPGSFNVATAVRTEVTADAVREILGELRRMQSGDLAAAELDEAKNYMMGVFPATVHTAGNLAGRLEDMEIYSLPDDWFDHHRERIGAVTATQVVEAANRYLDPDHVVIVVAGDADAIRESMAEFATSVEVVKT